MHTEGGSDVTHVTSRERIDPRFFGFCVFTVTSRIVVSQACGRFGEEWLYEAMLGSYIPFLDVLRSMPCLEDKSYQDGSSGKLPISVTIGVTPILLDQLDDDYMRNGFIKWTQARIKAC